jgi:hypothetical protein
VDAAALRCPVCHAIAWRRGGFLIAANDEVGDLIRTRVAPSTTSRDDLPWACDSCGHVEPHDSDIGRGLQELRELHLD